MEPAVPLPQSLRDSDSAETALNGQATPTSSATWNRAQAATRTPVSNSSNGRRPTPIRIPAPEETAGKQGASTPSPRAALVAGLRSATHRRREERDREQHTILGQMSPPGSPSPAFGPSTPLAQAGLKSGPPGTSQASAQVPGPSAYQQQQQQQSGSPSSSGYGANMDSRMYAALQAKQQELLATGLYISQQQQRIQQAMSNVVAQGYADSNGSPLADSMAGMTINGQQQGYPLNVPGQRGSFYGSSPQYGGGSTAFNAQLGVSPQSQFGGFAAANNNYYNAFGSASPNQGGMLSKAMAAGGTNGGYGGWPSTGYPIRPSSPSLPVRPRSSASGRGSSSAFFPSAGAGGGSGGAASFSSELAPSSPPSNHQSPAPPFRRGHRKASSLSYTTNSSSAASSAGRSASPSLAAMMNRGSVLSGSRAGNGEYQIPIRQPFGPPPLDELKSGRSANFVGVASTVQQYSSVQN